MQLSQIKSNPNNPRVKKDDKFQKLVKSIDDFPKMMALRPMIINENNIVLGGNMRLEALKYLGYKEIPDNWVKKASELTQEEQDRFVISDNLSFGEWDWDVLKEEWDHKKLEEWGLELPDWEEEVDGDEDSYNGKEDESNMIAVVLSDEDYEKWCELKTKMDKFNDKTVIQSLIKMFFHATDIKE